MRCVYVFVIFRKKNEEKFSMSKKNPIFANSFVPRDERIKDNFNK